MQELISFNNGTLDTILVTSVAASIIVAIGSMIRNFWKRTIQDNLDIKESTAQTGFLESLLSERDKHIKSLNECYDRYNTLVLEYGKLLATAQESKAAITHLQGQVEDLKQTLDNRQKDYDIKLNSLSDKLDKVITEKNNLVIENVRLKSLLDRLERDLGK